MKQTSAGFGLMAMTVCMSILFGAALGLIFRVWVVVPLISLVCAAGTLCYLAGNSLGEIGLIISAALQVGYLIGVLLLRGTILLLQSRQTRLEHSFVR
jgi:hypothetical protein